MYLFFNQKRDRYMRKMGDSADMKHEKFKMVIMGTALCMSMLFLSACGTLMGDPQDQNIAEDITKEDEEEVNDETLSEEEDITYPVYEVESIDNLQLDNKEFHIENYYIKNQSNNLNRYYIDSDNVLWGYGRNDYGQLGNGEQNSLGDYVMTPQKIAENVVHVDANQYFTIYLTEKGELYGIGANLNGIMGMEITEDYITNPAAVAASTPVCLLQDVRYARVTMRGIAALKKDGSVWWWGEIITTSAKNIEKAVGLQYSKPVKMLDHAIYVTCGQFCMAAIKEDGTLWTWGNNTFGSCGYDSGDRDFIEEPVMVLEDVKMVWMDEVRFDTIEKTVCDGYISPYRCQYPYVTFVEKKDGSVYACGYEVEGEGSKSWTYLLYGDILRTDEDPDFPPVTVTYSDVFQRISIKEKDRQPQLKFKDLKYGTSVEEVMKLLDDEGIEYRLIEGVSEERYQYEIITENYNFIFGFGQLQDDLRYIEYSSYGIRNGKVDIGMTREEVEKIWGKPYFEESFPDEDHKHIAYYEDDYGYRVVYIYGIACYIDEEQYTLLEQIKETQIDEQTYDISLKDWGDVTFVSCKPQYIWEDATFYLMKDEQILYIFPHRFPYNGLYKYIGIYDNVGAVAFRDINNDHKKDIIIISYYLMGAGPDGMTPRPGVTIYIASDNSFYIPEELDADIEENVMNENRTIEYICQYAQNYFKQHK